MRSPRGSCTLGHCTQKYLQAKTSGRAETSSAKTGRDRTWGVILAALLGMWAEEHRGSSCAHVGRGEDRSRWAARSAARSHKLQTDAVLVGKTDGNQAVLAAGGRKPTSGSQHQCLPSTENMERDCCGWGGWRDPRESCTESRAETKAEAPLCITHTDWEGCEEDGKRGSTSASLPN